MLNVSLSSTEMLCFAFQLFYLKVTDMEDWIGNQRFKEGRKYISCYFGPLLPNLENVLRPLHSVMFDVPKSLLLAQS